MFPVLIDVSIAFETQENTMGVGEGRGSGEQLLQILSIAVDEEKTREMNSFVFHLIETIELIFA